MNVVLPTALRRFINDRTEFLLNCNSVGSALRELATSFPDIRPFLLGDNGRPSGFDLYLNGEPVRNTSGVGTPLHGGDRLMLIPSISGGSASGDESKAHFSGSELIRYSRHLIMPEVGLKGQSALRAASVLLVGAGALGTPSAMYLAAAGVGRIGIVDFDVVEKSNLHRQVLYSERDIGRYKTEVAKERLVQINPNVDIELHQVRLESSNAMGILKDYDIILDGADNFPTGYLVNDACVLLDKPNVYASIFRFDGQASVFHAKKGPCYRCLYPEPPPPHLVPSCAEGGVLGVLPGIMGSIQATEAINLILGKGNPLIGRLLLFNALDMKFTEFKLKKNPQCPVCGPNPTVKELIDYEDFCGIREEFNPELEVTAKELKQSIESRNVVVLDVREQFEYDIGHIQGSKSIPVGELPQRVNELDTADEIVVYCHGGYKSAQATQLLSRLGFKKVKTLRGGISAWRLEVEPTLPVY